MSQTISQWVFCGIIGLSGIVFAILATIETYKYSRRRRNPPKGPPAGEYARLLALELCLRVEDIYDSSRNAAGDIESHKLRIAILQDLEAVLNEYADRLDEQDFQGEGRRRGT